MWLLRRRCICCAPRFIAISDRYVRPSLGIRNPSYKLDDNLWYAERAVAVQRAVRLLGQENEREPAELQGLFQQPVRRGQEALQSAYPRYGGLVR